MKRQSHARKKSSRRQAANEPPSPGASSARRAVRDELAAIVEHSNDAIFSRTFDGRITTWNAAAARIFGFSAAEIIGRSSRVLLPRGRLDEFRQLMVRMRRGEVVEQFETEHRRKDGQRIHVSLTLSPIRDVSGRLAGFSTIARDITARRHLRDSLARREQELEDLFGEASVGLAQVARDGTILRVNHAFAELLASPAEQVTGRTLMDFHPDPAAVKGLLHRLTLRQTLHNFPTELRSRDGSVRHVLVDANALWENGRFVHSRWFVRDISRRKQLERELLELSERERRGFAQELHDGLGQQLGGIAYLSNVLREKLTARNTPEAGESARIFALVREAIEQTRRISRGLSPIRPEPDGLMIALRELAAQTSELFRVRCRFYCPQPVLMEDSSRAGHLYRIVQEAVNNALKHAKPRHVNLRLRRACGKLILVVTDDGIGIGPIPPHREGLGLRIMQYRASLVRGTLVVQPRRGRGTEVICSVPGLDVKAGPPHN
jgi:PAS domain S-box-containing protein